MLKHIRLSHWLSLAALGVSMSAMVGCESTATQMDSQNNVQLIAGTYNTKGSEGLYGLSYNTRTQRFTEPHLLAKAGNPSWVQVNGNRVYVTNELGDGRLTTYSLSDEGTIQELGSVLTNGASPCYISLSPDQKYLATANYMGGNVSIFTLDGNQVPLAEPQVLQNFGKGPNTSRQEAAHVHWVQWSNDQKHLYSVDLGTDEIKIYPFDPVSGKAGKGDVAFKLQPGDGPRHLYFHPQHNNIAYILNELSNTLVVVRVNNEGYFSELQRVYTLPSDFTEHSQAAHLYITGDGKHLYASNRGHDSIAVFAVGADGKLSLQELEPVLGDWPRHFTVLESQQTLLVANQESNNIVAFKIEDDGNLSPLGEQVAVPQSTFLGTLK